MRMTLCQWTSPCSRAKGKDGKRKDGKGKAKSRDDQDKTDSKSQGQEVFLL